MRLLTTAVLGLLLLAGKTLYADVRPHALFGDNMVLQRDMKVPVYGWADAGEVVQVTFMGKTYKTTTAANGRWLVKLNSYKAGGPYEMKISGKTTQLTYKNILVGDVWLCSGQSNMEFGIQNEKNGKEAMRMATDDQIHYFYVPMTLALQPVNNIAKASADPPNGKWLVGSPEMMANSKFGWGGFSAVGFYFAQQIRKSVNVPLGMIASYRGGTPAESWMGEDGLKQSPELTKAVARHKYLVDHYKADSVSYPARMKAFQDSMKAWNEQYGKAFEPAMKKWEAEVKLAKQNLENPPDAPKPPGPQPKWPWDAFGGYNAPTTNWNAMINPLLGYGIKGVLWYQGESNGDNLESAVAYKDVFPRMINYWRAKWGQGNFPFLYVQLPGYRAPGKTPSSGNWPWVREAQQKTLALPKTGMAVIIDAGETYDIHPSNKVEAGERLALVAERDVYGQKVVSSGPIYKSMRVEGNKVILTFDEVNNGLVAGRPPRPGEMTTMDIKELKGFGIAGSDRKFVWAKAQIKGNTVELTTDEISRPVAVRYNWNDNPPGNLYNLNGLPARPFRTDDWSAL